MQTPYRKLPSTELIARVRRYIAEYLQDGAVSAEGAHEIPREFPHSFEEERRIRGAVGRRDIRKEPELFGAAGIAIPDVGGRLGAIFDRLKSRLAKADETFSDRLLRLIDERGMTDAEAYKRAGIDRKHFSKIRNEKDKVPKARVVYAFIFALGLNLDEAKDLLASAGYSISHAREFDLIMEFCITEGCDIDTVNGILYELELPLL